MSTIFITCVYNGFHNSEYGGRNRETMYSPSLKCITGIDHKIVCFTNKSNYNKLLNDFTDKSNLTFDLLELEDIKYHNDIMTIKRKYPGNFCSRFWAERNVHIMWGKLIMMKRVIEQYPEVKLFYWIDAGLSNDQIITKNYFTSNFTSKGLYTKTFVDGLIKYTNNKLLALVHTRPNNAPLSEDFYEDNSKRRGNAMIGGIFGGNRNDLLWFIEQNEKIIKELIKKEQLCSEESIYSVVLHQNPEKFSQYIFDTFYHRDWPNFNEFNNITFSSFFDTMLNYGENK